MILEMYNRIMAAGDFFAQHDIHLRAMGRSSQKKRRRNQRQCGGKRGGKKR